MPAMIPEWLAALAEAPARLRTRKTAKRRNVREIDLENPDAVRQCGGSGFLDSGIS
jgi:hypothetical protein